METKRKISLMLAVVLLMQIMLPMLTIMFESELTLFSRAEEGQNTWDISATNQDHVTATFDEETGILTISGTGEMKNWTSSYNVPWTKVTEKIKNVTIEEGVTTIGGFAFYSCRNLRNITIPESVTEIRSWVFKYCTNLISIDVKEKNNNYCSENGILFNKNKTELIRYPAGKQESSYSIPWEVTSIGDYAFSDCTSLSNITIPESVTRINNYVFSDCTSLININIPASLKSVPYGLFYGCTSLTNIDVEKNSKNYCSESGILFNKNKTELICYPAGKQEASYSIPWEVTSIGHYAFYKCASLSNITIPDSVKIIKSDAFFYCTKLNNVVIPEGVTRIESDTFRYCTSLSNITIPQGLTSIGSFAFTGCTSLNNFTIQEGVTNIENYAFSSCTSLSNITIPASVTNIQNGIFKGCTSLTNIDVEEKNNNYCSENGILFNKNKTNLICYPAGKQEMSYSIPNSVINIEVTAFSYCTSLNNIIIPASVTSIGVSAFEYCQNLTKIKISNKISSIGQNAFRNTKLSYIEIPQGKTAGNIDMGIYKENEKDLNENTKVATGMNIKISNKLCKVVVKGDLNGDGQVGDVDLLRLARYKVGLDTNLTGEYLQAADLNGNKNLADDIDLLMMARALVGLYNL